MVDNHQPIDEYSQAYRMLIDVDAYQYIEVNECFEGIVDDDEYESLKIFTKKPFDNDSDA